MELFSSDAMRIDVKPMSTLTLWLAKDIGIVKETLQIQNVIVTTVLRAWSRAPSSEPPEVSTSSEKTTSESDPKGRLLVPAPKAVCDLWTEWREKYALFVHRAKPLATFSDLRERGLLCVWVDEEGIVGDARSLCTTGGVECQISIGNYADACAKHIVENPDLPAICARTFAQHYELQNEAVLVEVDFVEDNR